MAATARQVRRGLVVLADHAGGASHRAAFPDDLSPDSVSLFLAARAAGWTPVPVPIPVLDSGAPAPEAEFWLSTPGLASRSRPSPGPELETLNLPAAPGSLERASRRFRDRPETTPDATSDGAASGAAPAGSSEQGLLGEAEALREALGPPARLSPDILVLARPLGTPEGPLLLTWSLLSPAVVLLEPEPAAFPATVLWARPTVLAGTASEVVAFAEDLPTAAAERKRRWWSWSSPRGRLGPLDRLRAVVVYGDEPLDAATREAWEEHGALVVELPKLLPERLV